MVSLYLIYGSNKYNFIYIMVTLYIKKINYGLILDDEIVHPLNI